jgi:hypothetical protein
VTCGEKNLWLQLHEMQLAATSAFRNPKVGVLGGSRSGHVVGQISPVIQHYRRVIPEAVRHRGLGDAAEKAVGCNNSMRIAATSGFRNPKVGVDR